MLEAPRDILEMLNIHVIGTAENNETGEVDFTKEIIVETTTTEDLWELEKKIVDQSVVKDPMSYNMAYGGKHYLDGLKKYDQSKFIDHQSSAGKIGGKNSYNTKSADQKKKWHSDGGKKATEKQKLDGNHPFFNGTAAVLGGKAMAGMIELWNPHSIATNKNQKEYRSGDCMRVRVDSEKHRSLINDGWRTISEHRNSRAW